MTCGTCRGDCPHPQACELPVARATKPPRVAFLMLALLRPVRAARVALLHWQLRCLRDEQRLYVDTGRAGALFSLESRRQQLDCMTRIRELEAQP